MGMIRVLLILLLSDDSGDQMRSWMEKEITKHFTIQAGVVILFEASPIPLHHPIRKALGHQLCEVFPCSECRNIHVGGSRNP